MARRRELPDAFADDNADIAVRDIPNPKEVGDLADLEDAEYAEWRWTIYRVLDVSELKPGKDNKIWVGRRLGPIDLSDIQSEFGGGRFEFWGRKGGEFQGIFRRTIEGEAVIRKAGAQPVPVASDNGTTPAERTEVDRLRALLRRERRRQEEDAKRRDREAERALLDSRFARLEAAIVQAQTARPVSEAKPERLKDLAETMLMLKSLGPDGANSINPLDLMKMAREWQDQGILLGEKREPGAAEDAGWNAERVTAIAQAMAGILSRFVPPPRPVPHGAPPPAGAAPRQPSGATVVGDAASAAPATPQHRWKSAIETVARGLLLGKGPDDMAATIEDVLNEEELASIRGAQGADGLWHPTASEALMWLAGQGCGTFPQLETQGGLTYLDSVLSELRQSADANPGD